MVDLKEVKNFLKIHIDYLKSAIEDDEWDPYLSFDECSSKLKIYKFLLRLVEDLE